MKIFCLLFMTFLTISNIAVGKSLREIIKKSAFMECENKSYVSSYFPDDIAILTYKNYLLFINLQTMLDIRTRSRVIPDEVYKKTTIAKVLYGNIFTGYGTIVSRAKGGFSPSANLNELTTIGRVSWWHDETFAIPEWHKSPEKGYVKPYKYSTKPIKSYNDKFSYYFTNVDGTDFDYDENFVCRMPSDEWLKESFKSKLNKD